jgi:hypothetical protein
VIQGLTYDAVKDAWNRWNAPFRGLSGNYQGVAEGSTFNLCLKVRGDVVLGTMTWPNDPDNQFYVDYRGKIDGEHVELKYARNKFHARKDEGDAAITPKENGQYQGYWDSTSGGGRQSWSLTRISPACKVLGYE